MIIYLGRVLLGDSSSLPESRNVADRHCFLLGLAPDGVYQANRVTPIAGELLPHRFTLATRHQQNAENNSAHCQCPFGGLLSVALSLVSRPVGVTDHPVLWSPDFPLAARLPPAII